MTTNPDYTGVEELIEKLERAYVDLNRLRESKRFLDDRYSVVEVEELGKFAARQSEPVSGAALERAWKSLRVKNEPLGKLRAKLRDAQRDIDLAEAEVDVTRKALNYQTARLNHLGGELMVQASLGEVRTEIAVDTKQDKTGEAA